MTTDIEEPLRVIVRAADEPPTILLEGELDPHTAPLLEQALNDLTSRGSRDVTLDLSGLEFMDSSGLRVIISAHKDFEAAGATLTLRNPTATIGRLLDVTNLRSHLRVED